jgi:hypothetical protein
MAPGLRTIFPAVFIGLILAGPAYWAGYETAHFLMRRETEEYRVWQESYHIDRRFYEAISKNPPPRYHAPRPWEGHLGGGVATVTILALTIFGATHLRPGSPTRAGRNSNSSTTDS